MQGEKEIARLARLGCSGRTGVGRRVVVLTAGIIGTLIAAPGALRAETRAPTAAAACQLKPVARHTVAAIVDAETIRLDDGREVRLADLRAPRAGDVAAALPVEAGRAVGSVTRPPSEPMPAWPLEQAVIAELGRRLVGRTVVIATDERAGARLTDRYGRLVAHVLASEAAAGGGERDDAGWLQAALLRDGTVRLEHGPGEAPCLSRLLVHEQAARRARRGLWREAAYASRDAAKPLVLYRLTGTLQVVEGNVVRAGVTRGRVYLDFGRERNRDFTASMRAAVARQLVGRGIDPVELGGRRVRIAGWLEWRGGPWIEITNAAQIEVIAEDGPDVATGRVRPELPQFDRAGPALTDLDGSGPQRANAQP